MEIPLINLSRYESQQIMQLKLGNKYFERDDDDPFRKRFGELANALACVRNSQWYSPEEIQNAQRILIDPFIEIQNMAGLPERT